MQAARFGLLAQALRREMGLDESEPPHVRQQSIGARVARHNTHNLGRVTQFLGELLSVPFPDSDIELLAAQRDPALMRDQIDRAWQAFLSDECRAHPVVLVLDDVQWGDLPASNSSMKHFATCPNCRSWSSRSRVRKCTNSFRNCGKREVLPRFSNT